MRRLLTFILVFALLLTLGCAAPSKKPEKLTKLTVNEVTHSIFYAPFYAAMELGYFKDEGIEIDLVNGGGSDKSMTALLSDNAHAALLGPETAVYVANEGKADSAVIIGQLTKCDGSFLVGREKDDGFTWDKLRGKTVIGGRKGGMPNMALEYAIKQNGLEIGKDVIVDTSIQFNLMAGAFEGSDADYVTLFEPTASLCEKAGKGYIVTSVGEESGAVPFTAFMVKKSTLEKERELYTSFMRAVYKGQTWIAKSQPAEIAKVIAPQFADSDAELLTAVAKNYKEIGAWKTDPVMLEQDFEHLLDVIDSAGELGARPEFSKVVDNSIAQNVIK